MGIMSRQIPRSRGRKCGSVAFSIAPVMMIISGRSRVARPQVLPPHPPHRDPGEAVSREDQGVADGVEGGHASSLTTLCVEQGGSRKTKTPYPAPRNLIAATSTARAPPWDA